MDNLSNVLERALATYFNVLSSTGYVCYNDVNKLLLLSLIEELTSGPMSAFIDDKDYNSMNNALYCIFGTSCLIPYPPTEESSAVYGEEGSIRISEDDMIRFTQDNKPRTPTI